MKKCKAKESNHVESTVRVGNVKRILFSDVEELANERWYPLPLANKEKQNKDKGVRTFYGFLK